MSPQPIPNMSTPHRAQGRLVSCDYAACRRPATEKADGWGFCRWHLHEHQLLKATEAVSARQAEELTRRISGYLLPSCSPAALLAVLHRPAQQKAGAA